MTARRLPIANRGFGIGSRRLRFGIRVALVVLLAATGASVLHAQLSADAAALRDRLRERYDIVMLQNGIGLVPRQPDARIGIVQIREGAVSINGQELTGRELRERLGADADLVLRVTYLDEAQQRQLAVSEPAAFVRRSPAASSARSASRSSCAGPRSSSPRTRSSWRSAARSGRPGGTR